MSRKQQANKENRKVELHPRNKHRGRYDFDKLISCFPDLKPFVGLNRHGNQSIDFSDPLAVKTLNHALLKHFYAIDYWAIPEGYLCPPIPGRADYIHHLADLLAADHQVIPTGKNIHALDIGVGANAIYPIIGCREYGWSFVGSDIDPVSVNTAQLIASSNKRLNKQFQCRLQSSADNYFKGIIQPEERFDFSLCNPPFHASAADVNAGSLRKLRNLAAANGQLHSLQGKSQQDKARLNFGGQAGELWCKGGEVEFIRAMIRQSADFSQQCYWFTTLVSKQENLPAVYRALKGAKVTRVETVKMAQSQKISRFVAWSFLSKDEQQRWREERWGNAG